MYSPCIPSRVYPHPPNVLTTPTPHAFPLSCKHHHTPFHIPKQPPVTPTHNIFISYTKHNIQSPEACLCFPPTPFSLFLNLKPSFHLTTTKSTPCNTTTAYNGYGNHQCYRPPLANPNPKALNRNPDPNPSP